MTSQEAAFSANMRVNIGGQDVQITVRGGTASEFQINWAQLAEDIGTFVESVHRVNGGVNAAGLLAHAPAPAPAAAPAPGWGTPPPAPAPAPSVDPWATPAQQQAPLCDHGQPRKFVAAGISKNTGQPYGAFWACQAPDRNQQCKTMKA